MFSLTGKTAVVTGGGSGIGKATALLLGAQGASVHVVDLDVAAAEETASAIRAADGEGLAHGCNVSVPEEVSRTFETIGVTDILVNCAGVSHIGTVETTSVDDFDRIYNINVKGSFLAMQAVIPAMKDLGRGVIINMASIASSVGLPDRFAYSMSKGAVQAMTLSVARDYVHTGVRCNSISPARVHTPFVDGFLARNYPGREAEMMEKLAKTQPIGRMAQPSEIAHLILYLCSDEAAFVTGCDYPIDGGFIKLNN